MHASRHAPTASALHRGFRRWVVVIAMAGGLHSAEPGQGASSSSAPKANLEAGLSRLREKKSGPAGEQGVGETAAAPGEIKPAPTAVGRATAPSPAVANPAPAPPAARSPATAPAPVAFGAAEAGRGFRAQDWQFVLAGILLLFGLRVVWTQEEYRMDAEELIKNHRISPERASRRVSNRRLAGRASIIGGLFLFLFALL